MDKSKDVAERFADLIVKLIDQGIDEGTRWWSTAGQQISDDEITAVINDPDLYAHAFDLAAHDTIDLLQQMVEQEKCRQAKEKEEEDKKLN